MKCKGREEELVKLIGDSGVLSIRMGNFDITINNKTDFPYYDVFDWLTECGYEVFINKTDGKINISTKMLW